MSDKPAASAAQAPPNTIKYAVGALAVSGLAGILSAVSMYGERSWLESEVRRQIEDDRKAGKTPTITDVPQHVSTVISQMTIQAVLLAALIGLLAWAVWRGRTFTKWGLFGFWVLLFFMYAPNGPGGLLTVTSNFPVGYRIGALLASVSYLAALVFVNLRPSVQFFDAHRATPRASHPPRGGRPSLRELITGRTAPPTAPEPATPPKGRATTAKRPPVQMSPPPPPAQPNPGAARPASKSRQSGRPKGK